MQDITVTLFYPAHKFSIELNAVNTCAVRSTLDSAKRKKQPVSFRGGAQRVDVQAGFTSFSIKVRKSY